MLVSDYDTAEEGYEVDREEMYPSPNNHGMPSHGLGGITDILNKVVDVSQTFAQTYYGITGQNQVASAPVSPKYVTSTGEVRQPHLVIPSETYAAAQPRTSNPVVPVLHLRGGIANPQPVQPSFFERNQTLIIGGVGIAAILLVVALKRR